MAAFIGLVDQEQEKKVENCLADQPRESSN